MSWFGVLLTDWPVGTLGAFLLLAFTFGALVWALWHITQFADAWHQPQQLCRGIVVAQSFSCLASIGGANAAGVAHPMLRILKVQVDGSIGAIIVDESVCKNYPKGTPITVWVAYGRLTGKLYVKGVSIPAA